MKKIPVLLELPLAVFLTLTSFGTALILVIKLAIFVGLKP